MAAMNSNSRHKPSITDMISLEVPLVAKASPTGDKVAYTVRRTDWNRNRYEALCYVYDTASGRSLPLTRSGDVTDLHWVSNDSLAVLRTDGSETGTQQVWLFSGLCGEGQQITDHETGVQHFRPFVHGIVYLADCAERKLKKARAGRFGNVVHFEQEESALALYYIGFDQVSEYEQKLRMCSSVDAKCLVRPSLEISRWPDGPKKIVSFITSPARNELYVNCQVRDDLVYLGETSVYRIRSASGFEQGGHNGSAISVERVMLPKGATVVAASPDGYRLLVRHKARDSMFYTQSNLFTLDLTQVADLADAESVAAHMHILASDLDREFYEARWTPHGLFASYADRTRVCIASVDSGVSPRPIEFGGIYPYSGAFDVSASGHLTFVGASRESYPEVYVSAEPLKSPECLMTRVTALGSQVERWDLGSVETIRWNSADGTEIEGVLRRPSGFDPGKKYPLVFVVHGGPTANSTEYLLERVDLERYPSVEFTSRDVLVLKPNYRGSIGYGQAFMELNKHNLGVGDLWDLLGAIEHLDSLGYLDSTKVGCMGWSQGGYISAFAGIHSNRFRAVSVGAGISNWYTYHISNDIPQFTTHYLSGTPFKNMHLYEKTSPMSKISEASTPTLIQHGSKDQRVPVSNATELYRGLRDMGVPTELFLFPEMGHPITRPREVRAVMHQNLTWFCHYLLGEPLDFEI